ncbi:AAA family ATPase [Pseudomonas avellanae]|uniref:AAA family ATPase n=1 Tax=Pseudomonas avellanae TaxID=46257 RepID=UPI0003FCD943|nr:AAA family ATPase [Pseudomonas avellanae]
MSDIHPQQLKELRKACGLTVKKAAASVHVHERTWRTYETDVNSASFTRIPKERLIAFCVRHDVPYPPISNDGRVLKSACKVISITTYKGGVGKSPITVAVAGYLGSIGKKVAIVTNDSVFYCRADKDSWVSHRLKGKASMVDFYGEEDVIMYPSEIEELEQALKRERQGCDGLDRNVLNPSLSGYLETLQAKKSAPHTFVDLTKRYDYLFLDLNRDLTKVKLLSNLVAVVLDNDCLSSIWSARNFCKDVQSIKPGLPTPILYGLITNHAPYSGREDTFEYIETPQNLKDAKQDVIEAYQHQAMVFQAAREVGIPFLNTFMTKAHAMEIDIFNSSRPFKDGFCYFNSLVEIAPLSPAADEIRRLVNELRGIFSDTNASLARHRA